jgi:hypothetical protein
MATLQLDHRRDLPKIGTANIPARAGAWLARNTRKFGTGNGYPGEFHREWLMTFVRPGSSVLVVTPHGGFLSGKVVLHLETHSVFHVTGSSGARPGLVDRNNIVWCSKAPASV